MYFLIWSGSVSFSVQVQIMNNLGFVSRAASVSLLSSATETRKQIETVHKGRGLAGLQSVEGWTWPWGHSD